jgi:hypothetical protein
MHTCLCMLVIKDFHHGATVLLDVIEAGRRCKVCWFHVKHIQTLA